MKELEEILRNTTADDAVVPSMAIKKFDLPVVYLDTNILVEMARYQKGKCCNSYKEEIADIYVVLIDKMKKREILCPLGNQLVEMGMSKGREQGRDFLFRFTNAKLLAPSIVEHIQLDMGYTAFTENRKDIELVATTFFDPSSLLNDGFMIHAAPIYSPGKLDQLLDEKQRTVAVLNEMKSAKRIEENFEKQLAVELSADSRLFLDTLINPFESTDAFARYLDMIGSVNSRVGITPSTAENEQMEKMAQYFLFLNSEYHHNLPYIHITASLWARRMQQTNKICDGDRLDTLWAASYLPFVDYAITDIAFCDILYELGIPEKYNAKVYSFRSLRQFLDEIS